ncbi:uncharacterized protein [Rutidosis leptorrhynchoides]|uniref:uncharacterized protein isoform X3 n=1 Tax=Rutidosis leptorrhynchoides TaxID=125765 RepID=UPI003A99D343
MVSIRRQRLIKLYGRSPFLDFISSYENGQSPASCVQSTRSPAVHPISSVYVDRSNEAFAKIEEPEPSSFNESNRSNKQPVLHPVVFKRRKRHRRKYFENQEVCVMRGVYFKNMKWQAAIKVDKKQIHLGTMGSQEEAARLYDRWHFISHTKAAFLCGREPNFELTDKEKDELSQLTWDGFLIMTRDAINSKKHQRRGPRMKFENQQQQYSDWGAEGEQGRNGYSDDAAVSLG